MNRHPRLLATAAVGATAAALLLSACGGDSGEASQGKGKEVSGQDTRTPASVSPSASATASGSASAGRPKIELPSDLSFTFDWPRTGDADKDRILADSEQSIRAVHLAIADQDPLDKAYLYYHEGEAAAQTEQYVKAYVKANARTTGAYRYYDAAVEVTGADSASLVYCEDQGKAYDMYLKPKRIDKTTATKNSYVLYSTQLHRNKGGVWVTEKLLSQRGSTKCRP